MKVESKFNYYILLIVVFGGFLMFGISENIKGPALPEIQSDFSVSEAQLGTLLALNALGFLLACSFTSTLINRIGLKLTSVLMFGSMALSGVFIYLSNSFIFLSASYFFLNIGNGMLEISLAIVAARIFTKNTGMMLNLSHFFYGLGSTVAPIFAASMMGWYVYNTELGWRGMFFVMLSFSLLPLIPVLLSKFPKDDHEQEDRISLKQLIHDPIAWLIVSTLSFGVIAELGMASWLVNYLVKVYEWKINDASELLSLFFLLFMFARLLLGSITDKFGYAKSIIFFSAFAGLCGISAILIGEKVALLFAIAGIGIAPVYPTVMALLAKRYPKGTDTAITFTVTLVGIGGVFGNLLIGFLIDFATKITESNTLGFQAGYAFISFSALMCSLCCVVIFVQLRKQNQLL
ncbi:MFS transporter [Aquibacillus rhizosphaerae]|uniref:MFS transporter n=1 Tax=Aquibacillus rhizosphaerae TaxID=3051431 RepID=A0ABT7LCZ0_9BACI|nr:MFS transporter [Aquibacillus sp. LR5S19]MDL4843127.1 MFS transporter [Aquibacillus sp. LR5S19]